MSLIHAKRMMVPTTVYSLPRASRSMVACKTMQNTVRISGPAALVHLKRGYRDAIFLVLIKNKTQDVPRRKVFQLNSLIFENKFRRSPCSDLSLGMLYLLAMPQKENVSSKNCLVDDAKGSSKSIFK